MIDPVEFGELKGALAAVQAQVADMKVQQAATNAKLDSVLRQLDEAKGGWRTLMVLGGMAATVSAGIAYVVDRVFK